MHICFSKPTAHVFSCETHSITRVSILLEVYLRERDHMILWFYDLLCHFLRCQFQDRCQVRKAPQLWIGGGRLYQTLLCASLTACMQAGATSMQALSCCFDFIQVGFRFWGRELAFKLWGTLSGNRTVLEKSLQSSGKQANTLSGEGGEQTTSLLLHSSYSYSQHATPNSGLWSHPFKAI